MQIYLEDFAGALTVLQCCIKPCLMVNVWYDWTHYAKENITGHEGRQEKE